MASFDLLLKPELGAVHGELRCLFSSNPRDCLESKMQREKEHLQDIIQEENTTPSEKPDAYER